MDPNALRRAIQAAIISPDDLNFTGNQLAQLLQGSQDGPMPQPRDDIAPMQMNTMRVENGPDAGKVTDLNFNKTPMSSLTSRMGQSNQVPIKMAGYGNDGIMSDLGSTMGPAPQLDMTRPQVDTPRGRGTYGKDGAVYVQGPDGLTKIVMGYDRNASMAMGKYDQERRKGEADIAQSQAATQHSQEATRASQVNNPDYLGDGGRQATAQGVTGDAFLQTLDPQTANEVKALANGDVPFNPRSQRQMNLLGLVTQYDPTFSASDYNARNATKTDFSTKGKSGQVVQAINQALHHADVLSGSIDALDNSNIAPGIVNPVKNWLEQKIGGDSRQGNFMTAANALSEELKKIYAGGGGSLTELQNWQKSFDPNAGQEQQRSYLKTGMQLLQGAIDSRKQAYERGMGPKGDFSKLIDPSAQAALDRLSGAAPSNTSGARSFANEAEAAAARLAPGTKIIVNGIPGTWH